jgi:hypothetical protein
MATNHLEELVAEWYEYQGYFVRRNILVGRRPKGGYDGELDIIAFSPTKNHLVHVEPSMDADSWATRERRYKKKFDLGRAFIPTLFEGFKLPETIEQIALLSFASKANHQTLGGGKIILVPELLKEIFESLKSRNIASNAVSENMPLLRTLQFVSDNWEAVERVMKSHIE